RAGADDRPQQVEVGPGRLANESEVVAGDRFGVEDALGDPMGGDSPGPDRFDQGEVLLGEHFPGDIEHLGGSDPKTILLLGLDSLLLQSLVELWPATMEHDRCQSDGVEKGKGCRGFFKTVAEYRSTDLDHRESGLIQRGETLQVGTDLPTVAHVGEELDDGLVDVGDRDVHVAPTSFRMIAFWTWSRFSASS